MKLYVVALENECDVVGIGETLRKAVSTAKRTLCKRDSKYVVDDVFVDVWHMVFRTRPTLAQATSKMASKEHMRGTNLCLEDVKLGEAVSYSVS